jgi:hypothetical protein
MLDMKKFFDIPEVEIIVLSNTEDILTASGELNLASDNETPDW